MEGNRRKKVRAQAGQAFSEKSDDLELDGKLT